MCLGCHYLFWPSLFVLTATICYQKLNLETAKMNNDDICIPLCTLILIWALWRWCSLLQAILMTKSHFPSSQPFYNPSGRHQCLQWAIGGPKNNGDCDSTITSTFLCYHAFIYLLFYQIIIGMQSHNLWVQILHIIQLSYCTTLNQQRNWKRIYHVGWRDVRKRRVPVQML